MKLLGIGNEQWHQQYIDRYSAFAMVLKTKHPEVRLVSARGRRPMTISSTLRGPNSAQ